MFTGTGANWAIFAANAGCRNGELVGSVTYEDRIFNFRLKSTQITGYLVDPSHPNARDICGRARINGSASEVRFRARLEDNAEPGTRYDRFGIVIDNWYAPDRFYVAYGPVWGNVQVLDNPGSRNQLPGPPEGVACADLPAP
jgi:hypothetical protein